VWRDLSELFEAVGMHGNHSIALYAVDSLRQLGMKFLEKDELFDYRFQGTKRGEEKEERRRERRERREVRDEDRGEREEREERGERGERGREARQYVL
jgi:hypothetical protein